MQWCKVTVLRGEWSVKWVCQWYLSGCHISPKMINTSRKNTCEKMSTWNSRIIQLNKSHSMVDVSIWLSLDICPGFVKHKCDSFQIITLFSNFWFSVILAMNVFCYMKLSFFFTLLYRFETFDVKIFGKIFSTMRSLIIPITRINLK